MGNKVLIKLIVPETNESFDLFIPVNETIWKVKRMIVKCINDIRNINMDEKKEYLLIKKDNNRIYKNNEIIIDTDIKNGSELFLMKKE